MPAARPADAKAASHVGEAALRDSDELAYMVKRTIGSSKFAFMQGDKVRLFGDYIECDGIFYSNLRFTNWLY